MTTPITIRYFEYEGIPCQLQQAGENRMAEGYFAGKGLQRIDTTSVIFHGEPITEKEFRAMVVALIQKN